VDFSLYVLPLLIFFAEVCVVTLGTVRIIFVARGQKILAPLLGFGEVFLWLLAMSQIMQNLSDWTCFFAFALGFSLGNYLGIIIEKKLAMGMALVKIITNRDADDLIEHLRAANFGVTSMDGQGANGKVQIVMSIVKRKQLPAVIELIETHSPGAFYAVKDLQAACEGIFPTPKERPGLMPLPLFKLMRLVMPADKQLNLPGHSDVSASNRAEESREPEPAAMTSP
jgi:uncharacterized protein YebE (UPF0316 family)